MTILRQKLKSKQQSKNLKKNLVKSWCAKKLSRKGCKGVPSIKNVLHEKHRKRPLNERCFKPGKPSKKVLKHRKYLCTNIICRLVI